MTEEKDTKQPGESAITPFMKMNEQIRHLDRSLNTIDGWTDESDHTRRFIVAQIEAIKWCLKQFDVG